MSSGIKRAAELLLQKAEEAYANHEYYRALELAMSVYGATVSTASRLLLEKAVQAIDHPTDDVNSAEQKPVEQDVIPAVKTVPTESKENTFEAGPLKQVEVAAKTPTSSYFKSAIDLVKSAATLFDPDPPMAVVEAVLPVETEEVKSNGISSRPPLIPFDGDSMQLAIRNEDTKSSAVIITYPPMASKEPDELYADALREADIDAKVGLNQEPKLSPEEKAEVDERAARAIIGSRDFFEMVDMKLWSEVPQVERAFKKAIFKVHSDRNGSPMAQQASEMLIAEYKKFKAKPREYTVAVEKRRAGDGEFQPFDPNTGAHEGYGGRSAATSEDGFDCYGKRSYTWGVSNSGPKRHTDVNPEGNGAMFASPMGEAAWLEKIEYSEATAHKFKNGKYQSFSYTGESRSKHGTRFIAKNNL